MSTDGGPDAAGMERAADLLARFLADRGERTFHAYRLDIEDFAASLGEPPAAAVALLLAHGPRTGARRVLEYAVGLRRRDLAPATVARRLATLRALARLAAASGLVDWSLEVPTEAEIESGLARGDTDDVPYLFPRHPTEIDRLDVQHYALREALGANHLAPVEAPRRVLDAGSGSGQWGIDLCEEFPQALVIGVDLVAGKRRHPDRYCWVRANLLQGLPFADGCFDYVHQRALVVGVPLPAWPALVRELVRVTRPGGWLELAEPRIGADRVGPATQRFNDLALELAGSLGLDTTGAVFASLDGYLRDAGLEDVVRREVALPVGEWGGRVGSLMATDTRAAYTRLAQLLHARGVLSHQAAHALLQRAQEECEELHTTGAFALACGRRPRG